MTRSLYKNNKDKTSYVKKLRLCVYIFAAESCFFSAVRKRASGAHHAGKASLFTRRDQ